VAPSQRVKRFVAILHKELDPDDAEIREPGSSPRVHQWKKYASIHAALYDPNATAASVRATVTYEDGRTSEMERHIRIMDLEGTKCR